MKLLCVRVGVVLGHAFASLEGCSCRRSSSRTIRRLTSKHTLLRRAVVTSFEHRQVRDRMYAVRLSTRGCEERDDLAFELVEFG